MVSLALAGVSTTPVFAQDVEAPPIEPPVASAPNTTSTAAYAAALVFPIQDAPAWRGQIIAAAIPDFDAQFALVQFTRRIGADWSVEGAGSAYLQDDGADSYSLRFAGTRTWTHRMFEVDVRTSAEHRFALAETSSRWRLRSRLRGTFRPEAWDRRFSANLSIEPVYNINREEFESVIYGASSTVRLTGSFQLNGSFQHFAINQAADFQLASLSLVYVIQ